MARCRCARNTADFKSKVALEALREQQPIHEIAKRYQVHASQVTEWKKSLQGNASSVFESTSAKHDEASQAEAQRRPTFEADRPTQSRGGFFKRQLRQTRCRYPGGRASLSQITR